MIVHVPEVVADLGVDLRVVPGGQAVERVDERGGGAPELEHLALEPVHALGGVRALAREQLGLNLVDVGLEAVDGQDVVVHHAVEDRVQHGAGSAAQPRLVVLEVLAHLLERAALAVANGDHEVVAEEHQQLAEIDHLLRIHVARGLQDEKNHVPVDLELRPLVRIDGVLHGQRVQVELAFQRVELLRRRLVQPDPDEVAVLPALPVGVLELHRAVAAPASS